MVFSVDDTLFSIARRLFCFIASLRVVKKTSIPLYGGGDKHNLIVCVRKKVLDLLEMKSNLHLKHVLLDLRNYLCLTCNITVISHSSHVDLVITK